MKISIITVSLNSLATIEDTFKSVLSQNHPDIEYLVVDGGSSDGTLEIINIYADRIDHVVSEPDQGIYDAMNKGVKLATGDIIGILNADDIYANSDVLVNVANVFQGNDSDVVFGDLVFVKRHDLNSITRYYSSKIFHPWRLKFGWMPPHPATFIRKSVYDKVGLYSLDYKIAADYEMFVRLLLVWKFSFFRIPQVLVKMRLGGASTRGLNSSWVLNSEIVKACRSNGVYTNILLVLSKIPFKLLELFKRPNSK